MRELNHEFLLLLKACKPVSGFLVQAVELIDDRFNFSLFHHEEKEFGWGTILPEMSGNMIEKWTGVMGDVIEGVFPCGLSIWDL